MSLGEEEEEEKKNGDMIRYRRGGQVKYGSNFIRKLTSGSFFVLFNLKPDPIHFLCATGTALAR